MKKKTMASIKPTTVSIQAMLTAVPAMPEKPNTAAISAMMKNVIAHEIIWSSSFKLSPNKSGDRNFPHPLSRNRRQFPQVAVGLSLQIQVKSALCTLRGALPGNRRYTGSRAAIAPLDTRAAYATTRISALPQAV